MMQKEKTPGSDENNYLLPGTWQRQSPKYCPVCIDCLSAIHHKVTWRGSSTWLLTRLHYERHLKLRGLSLGREQTCQCLPWKVMRSDSQEFCGRGKTKR